MKTRYRIQAIAAISLLAACSYLEENPRTAQVPSTVYTTEGGVRSVLVGCYVQLTSSNYYSSGLTHMGVNSVMLASKNSQSNQVTCQVGTMSPITDNFMTRPFQAIYTGINQCNDLLANLAECDLGEDFRLAVEAEAKFLRAFHYFNIVRLFGRCPLRVTPCETIEDTYCERSSLRKVYAQILEDLQFAFDHMPDKDKQAVGYPHRWAARAFMAKVYVQMACLTQDHFDCTKEPEEERYTPQERAEFWQNGYDAALEVYQSGKYQLAPLYASLWNNRSKNTEESIFEVQFNKSYGTDFGITIISLDGHAYTPPGAAESIAGYSVYAPNYNGDNTNWGRLRPTKWVFCEHWTRYGNGKRCNDISTSAELNADPRFNVTYQYYTDDKDGVPGTQTFFPNRGFGISNLAGIMPYLRKYWYDEYNGRNDQNMKVFRYADLLLTLAEAANEIGLTGEAVGYVNQVLDRAADADGNGVRDAGETQPVQWPTGMNQVDFRNDVMFERIFELLGENHEMFDVRRRGADYLERCMERNNYWRAMAKETVANGGWGKNAGANYHNTEVGYDYSNRSFLVQNLFFPIPKNEIQHNSLIPESDQNLGWENQ
ncbi:starch-binding protein [Bacteroidia bacterium]|nr:starch-binding protein [Bacteroidia bacterium]